MTNSQRQKCHENDEWTKYFRKRNYLIFEFKTDCDFEQKQQPDLIQTGSCTMNSPSNVAMQIQTNADDDTKVGTNSVV
jgi:hypothetical protein